MSRIPCILQEKCTDAQKRLFDSIIAERRQTGRSTAQFLTSEGGLVGPFNAWLHSPVLGDALQRLGAAVRFGSSLAPRLRELAIIVVAAKWKAAYEWHMHSRIARAEGLDEPVIESLRTDGVPNFDDPDQSMVYRFVREMLDTHQVSDHTYRKTVDLLGEAGVVELVILCGYYTTVAMTLNAFKVPLPPGEKDPF